MSTKLLIAVCVAVAVFGRTTPGRASESQDPIMVVGDVVAARPACFAVTAFGAAFFVVSLPFAAISKSVHKTANTLVVKPANATFTRPLGDLDPIAN